MVAFIAFSGKSNTGLPIATLSPTVNVYRLSDFAEVATAVPAVYIDDASDPSLGGYRVSSANTPNVDGEDYYWEADLDPGAVIGLSDSRRYKDGVYSGTTNARIETDIPAIFADVASLDDVKITTARANLLDEITALRLAELDPANLPADIDTLITRLTAARAANLDEITAARLAELDGANMPGDIDALGTGQGVLATAIAGVPAAVDVALSDDVKITTARANLLDEITALRLAELDPANLPADIDTLITRLTAARAANLDEITAARLAELDGANMPGDIDALGTGSRRVGYGYRGRARCGGRGLERNAWSRGLGRDRADAAPSWCELRRRHYHRVSRHPCGEGRHPGCTHRVQPGHRGPHGHVHHHVDRG